VEQASLLGSGPVIEVAVRMHQFAEEGLLSRALGTSRVTGEQLERFAEHLARFHGDAGIAAPEGPFGTAQAVKTPALASATSTATRNKTIKVFIVGDYPCRASGHP
jgi:aminoglycoside phosphotransferase family enzyme